ncbi:hypothetical protein [Deinococcus sp. QL22]|uniref:hypothetical protein n=1 Tax=Deinococcus sp. QL22 TaxID=2939437 RepID=UPI00201705CB|nr:hypothetical protein [Deinococcus sp. QL22]UQN09821.1 hypothetical protein M1R55_25485 [Deinococcus sp. QL22]
MIRLTMLTAMLILCSTARAAATTQAAILTAVQSSGSISKTLTLDFIELYRDSPTDIARAIRARRVVSQQEFWLKAPGGLMTFNTNPQLRKLKTTPRTTYELQCLNTQQSIRPLRVSEATFFRAWQGSTTCWPLEVANRMVVELTVEGAAIVKITQVYLP